MSYQAPIFESGLFGKANRFVCNGWTQSAQTVAQHAEGIEWAQQQLIKPDIPTRWLALITQATYLYPNRWSYTFEPFAIDTMVGVIPMTSVPLVTQPAGDKKWGVGQGAINLRELDNTSSIIDGSPLPSGASIGPVGSRDVNGTWLLVGLRGHVEINMDYRTDGQVLYWFSSPNPVKCS